MRHLFQKPLRLTANGRTVAVVLACALLAQSVAAADSAPPGDDKEEVELGEQTDSLWAGSMPMLLEDNSITRQVEALVQSLVPACDRPHLAYRVAVVNDPADINAYAGPGGYVYVTTGLLEFLGSTDELALTLTHELAHVSQRHQMKYLRQEKRVAASLQIVCFIAKYGIPLAQVYIMGNVADASAGRLSRYSSEKLAEIVGQLSAKGLANVVSLSAIYISTTATVGYGREQEREADRLGLSYLKRQGQYDPAAAISLFRRFDVLEKHADAIKLEKGRPSVRSRIKYLTSHPMGFERLKQAEAFLNQMKVPASTKPLTAAKIPKVIEPTDGPLKAGPEVFLVMPAEAWFSVRRIVASDFRIKRVVSADSTNHQIQFTMGTPESRCTLLAEVRAADPAGAEVRVEAVSSKPGWWPTIFMGQVRAELGAANYRCLEGVAPGPAKAPRTCLEVPGEPATIYAALRSALPWYLLSENESAGLLDYRATEGTSWVQIKVLVSGISSGQCRIYVRQGPMATAGRPAVKWVFDEVKKVNRASKPTSGGPL